MERDYLAILKRDPGGKKGQVWFKLGQLYSALGGDKQAKTAFSRAAAANPASERFKAAAAGGEWRTSPAAAASGTAAGGSAAGGLSAVSAEATEQPSTAPAEEPSASSPAAVSPPEAQASEVRATSSAPLDSCAACGSLNSPRLVARDTR